jgi:hypothetical protein
VVWSLGYATLRHATPTFVCRIRSLSNSHSHRATLASPCSGSDVSEDGVHGYYLPTYLPTYLPILLPTLIHEISTRQLYLLLPFRAGRGGIP